MATIYVTCLHCHSQNPGTYQSCLNCGTLLPISPMPMQRVASGAASSGYPGKLQAISIIQTAVGGIEILMALFWALYTLILGIATFGIGLLLIPLPLILLTIGILSLVTGIRGLNKNFRKKMSFGVAIAQMVLLLGCDVLSFGAGLACVLLLTQDDTKAYLESVGQG